MIKTLIKIADQLDRKGKHELAGEVDKVICVLAARKKAPLKHLDDDVKKDTLKFISKTEKNLRESVEMLEELFRRLRYFNVGGLAKKMKLEEAVKSIKTTHNCVDSAAKKMYEMSYGKSPSKDAMEQLANDFNSEGSLPLFSKPKKENVCNKCKGTGYSGPLGDTCESCEGSGAGMSKEEAEWEKSKRDWDLEQDANTKPGKENVAELESEKEEVPEDFWDDGEEN